MTDDTKQDHPGPEWVRHEAGHPYADGWFHPVLRQYASTPEQCRAISAAAQEWEFRRGRAFADGMTASGNFTHLMRGLGQ